MRLHPMSRFLLEWTFFILVFVLLCCVGHTQEPSPTPTVNRDGKTLIAPAHPFETIKALTINGVPAASQYQTGAGGNGIANAFQAAGSNSVVKADPGNTEGAAVPAPANATLEDSRPSSHGLYAHNPARETDSGQLPNGFGYMNTHNTATADHKLCFFDALATPDGQTEQDCLFVMHYDVGPSINYGIGGGGDTVSHVFSVTAYSARAGLLQPFFLHSEKHGTGEFSGFYLYPWCAGGSIRVNDEGCEQASILGGQLPTYFHGTVASTAGTGDSAPVLSFVSGGNFTTAGGFLLDISKPLATGHMTGNPSTSSNDPNLFLYPTDLPHTGAGAPVASTWGVSTTSIAQAANVTIPTTATIAVSFYVGTAFVSGLGCIADNYPEHVTITPVDSTHISVSGAVYPHLAASYSILQGPGACSAFSWDADVAQEGLYQDYFAFGWFDDGTKWDLIHGYLINGQMYSANRAAEPGRPAGFMESLISLARAADGVTVTATPKYAYFTYASVGMTATISGAAGDFNGTVNSVTKAADGTLTWQQAGTASASSAAGSIETVGLDAAHPLSAFTLYPYAEIAYNTTWAAAPVLHVNSVPWAVGDSVVNPSLPSVQTQLLHMDATQISPSNNAVNSVGVTADLHGYGVSGAYAPFTLHSSNPASLYKGFDGTLDPVTADMTLGFTSHVKMRLVTAPVNFGSVISVGCQPGGTQSFGTDCADLSPYNVFSSDLGGAFTYYPIFYETLLGNTWHDVFSSGYVAAAYLEATNSVITPLIQTNQVRSYNGSNLNLDAPVAGVNVGTSSTGGVSLGEEATMTQVNGLFSLAHAENYGYVSGRTNVVTLNSSKWASIASAYPDIATPTTSADACEPGKIWADATYIYACTASGVIKRAALTAF